MIPDTAPAVVVFALREGDATILRTVIEDEGARARPCTSAAAFYAAIDDNALAAVVTEEALACCTLPDLNACLARQPAWSDLPLLVLADADSRAIDDGRFVRLAGIGNITLLTRPIARAALALAIRSALRTRSLQFAVRDQLEQLQQHSGQLASTVALRTESLEREVLERRRVEQELAEARRLESLGQLTGGIAHDFNNILQVIAGSETLLRLLTANAPDLRVTRALDGIRRASSHGASLTQQLLAYARRQPLASVVLDPHVHLRATTEMIRRTLADGVHLQLDIAAALWPVLADPAQLDAALLNICSNAQDAMPGGGALTLHARNWTLPDLMLPEGADLVGDFVGLCVTDEGAGMSDEVARQAFEPFFTTKPVGKGTGLGLSQVYGFAIQSQGQAFIRRESTGTTIGILLPRSRDDLPQPDIDPSSMRADGLRGVRVLFVEDDPDVASTTGAMLESTGSVVQFAGSADAAIGADLEQVDIVFSDVSMPGTMDGIELARWLAVRHPDLPVVLTSGYMLSPERLQTLKVHFVRKPASMAAINEAFLTALRGRDPRANDGSRPRRRP